SEEGEPASVRRFTKSGCVSQKPTPSGALTPVVPPAAPRKSIFGGEDAAEGPDGAHLVGTNGNGVSSPPASGLSTPRLGFIPGRVETEEWRFSDFVSKHAPATEITASAVDMSAYAVMTAFEDPLLTA